MISAGYYVTLWKGEPSVGPPGLTVSDCLAHLAPDWWGLGWTSTGPNSDPLSEAARFGVRPAHLPALQSWASAAFDTGDFRAFSTPLATTADGGVDLVNRQFLGMSLAELKDSETSDAVTLRMPRVVTAWRQSLERGEPCEAEQRIRHADTYQWVHVRSLPIRGKQDLILRWCVLLTDFAEHKCAEVLLDGKKRLLEMVTSGCPLEDVLLQATTQ